MLCSTAYVVVAALCWGISGGIGGILMANGWDTYVVSFYRGLIGLLFALIWLALKPRKNGLRNCRLWFWSVIAGLGITGNFAFYFFSIAEGSVAVAATLMYSAPVFVYLVSFTLKLERPTLLKWIAIVMVVIGIVLLTRIYEISSSDVTLVAAGTGLLAGVSYAVFIFGLKYAAPHGSSQAILTVAFAVLSILLIWPADIDQVVAVLNAPTWLDFVTIGVFGAGLSFALYLIGLNRTEPAVASIVAIIEPVTASLFGVVILNENLIGLQVFGMGLILVTVTMLSVSSNARWILHD